MAGLHLLLKLFAGAAAGGAGKGAGLGRMAGQGLAKGLLGGAARGFGGMADGKGGCGGRQGGGGSGKGCGQGRSQGDSGEHLVKIVELVAKRLAERNADQTGPAVSAQPTPALEAPAGEPLRLDAAAPLPAQTIDVQAVAMTAYACRLCGLRIAVAADAPLAEPRCPQCGSPMNVAP